MARTAAGNAQTALHRRAQLAIQALTARELIAAWPLFRGDARSWAEFERIAATIIRGRYRDSAGLAAAYYRAFRDAEEVGGTPPLVRIPDPPPTPAIVRSLGATGLAGTYRALSVGKSREAALAIGVARLVPAGTRHVLNGGRETILSAAAADGQVARYRRVTGGKPCKFCTMLAGRGPAYRAESTAHFDAHDGCACFAEPVLTPATGRRNR